jgi:hypothetical protein
MPGRYEPVLWDKSIHEQEDGTFVLVLRADDRTMNVPRPTLLAAQATMDFLPPDGGEVLAAPPRSVFNPTTKGL